MRTHRIPALSAACLALTGLSLSTLGTASATSMADTVLASKAKGERASRKGQVPTPQPGIAPPTLGPSSIGGEGSQSGGLPLLTQRGVRSLRVGDPVSLPTPDGDVIRYEVDLKGFTDAETSHLILRSAGRETTYGVIVQRGDHLAGFLQRLDGRAYRLMPAGNGSHRLERIVYPNGVDCGVGRVPIEGMASPEMLAARDGVAGAPGVTPCPPEAAPFDLPQTLRKDSGMIIDVLFVFTQDSAELALAQGRDIRTLAALAVAQANVAMLRSTRQGIAAFDGQDGDNRLNGACGYGNGGFPIDGPACEPSWPEGMSGTCKDDTADPPNNRVTTHVTLAGVTPAEDDICTPRIRLVAALVADGFFGLEAPYDSTGLPVDLSRVQNPFDGYMDYVQTWRDALGADAVCLVGRNYGEDSEFIGLASLMVDANNGAQALYAPEDSLAPMPLNAVGNPHPLVDLSAMPNPDRPFLGGAENNEGLPFDPTVSTLQAFQGRAYSLLDYTAIDDLVYAHELGHNLGCQHNHDDGDRSADALFPDSFGYRTQGGGGGEAGLKTVMSYGNQTRLPGFSNPELGWGAFAPGNPDVPNDAAGIAFDFACTQLDGDGTDVQYIPGRGINRDSCEPSTPQNQCDNETDEDPNSTDPAPMVVRTDVEIDDQLDEDQSGGANNSRSISQTKFDFAKFRCSVFPVVDCNDDTVDDFVQALDGFLADCNQNGIPDQCETTFDPGSDNPNDCNGNEIPDECEIRDGLTPDDNANLVPDECEDQTRLFAETFESQSLGFVEGALPIAEISANALKELRELDPAFPDYFATVETVGLAQAPGNGGYVFYDVRPNAFQYRLGGNGERSVCPAFDPLGRSATSGFARAIGNRGYGQALNFDSTTGDFPSQAGITTITAARDCREIRMYLNTADFSGYFDFDPPLPLLRNYPYLEENVVFISAFNEQNELVFEQSLDLRGQWTPEDGLPCPQDPNPQGLVFLRIGPPLGSSEQLAIRSVEIRGAFVVIDNVSFQMAVEDDDDGNAFPCIADIAGGPLDPIGIPTPDGRVGGEDLLVVLATYGWGLSESPNQFTSCPPDNPTPGEELARLADINEDCQVDGMDLLEVLAAWGQCLGGTP